MIVFKKGAHKSVGIALYYGTCLGRDYVCTLSSVYFHLVAVKLGIYGKLAVIYTLFCIDYRVVGIGRKADLGQADGLIVMLNAFPAALLVTSEYKTDVTLRRDATAF